MKKSLSQLLPVTMFGALALFVACSEVQDSGRKQVNFMNPREEAALGISEFNKMKAQMKISTDPASNALVKKVGRKLSKVMPVPHAEWEFVVFDDPSPNAFALPGGKVGVHTGLFEITESEEGLAAVIGHEVAHVVSRHSGERMSRGILTAGAVAVSTYILNKKAGIDPGVAAAGSNAAAKLNFTAHSRDQELEADRIGALYMARAGYNPRESVKLWERFAAYRDRVGQNQGFSFLSTHPVDSVRITELKKHMPEAMKEYRKE